MIITHNNRPIKMIPKRFEVIENLTDYLEDFDHIRLSDDERENLNQVLFENEISEFIETMKDKEPLVYERIENQKPIHVARIKQLDGEIYYTLKFRNNMAVRCPERLYKLSPVKVRSNVANSFQRSTTQEEYSEQLKCF